MSTLAELLTQKIVLEEQIANFQENDKPIVNVDAAGEADCRIQDLTTEYDSRLS